MASIKINQIVETLGHFAHTTSVDVMIAEESVAGAKLMAPTTPTNHKTCIFHFASLASFSAVSHFYDSRLQFRKNKKNPPTQIFSNFGLMAPFLFLLWNYCFTKTGVLQFLKWGSVSCRWRYCSRMIACSVFLLLWISFINQNKTSLIRNKCCHLTTDWTPYLWLGSSFATF